MKSYAIVGAGVRALSMFARPLVSELGAFAKLVGICDVNLKRAETMSRLCGGSGIAVFDDFDNMLKSTQPDTIIVTTIDRNHHEFIIRALEAGCDVISEKPLTIDADKMNAIFAAEKKTGRSVTVTFNCRFIPYMVRIKELLASGVVGDIHNVHFEWFLDTKHGADYFRRWHRRMSNSGGLLVHKSTHHFDLVNWWLDDVPETVHGFGDLRFYGRNGAHSGERCQSCEHRHTCDFYYDITANETIKQLYFQAEAEDGYIRDQCVFAKEIDIYDTMTVQAKYEKGASLSYSLTTYNPMEGWRIAFVGSKGRMEAEDFASGPFSGTSHNTIRLFDRKGDLTTVQVRKAGGGHGGGDERLRRMIFAGDLEDPLGQQAGSWEGAMSLLIGAAANVSIAEKKPVVIRELLQTKPTLIH
ncbi:Gfo/Idh/MocA family protein [Paenibacillus allorhizosphaerae]|uniref:Oxidoreductase YteT n=1 Tax=Paenibacillus allorhizosphaerae TaxID=2849866 RepID=A0ABM8VGB2_9BACL|nr:Gfo/Idh/MocA family oxidoreductase [Paenibacillus allorhizosphaerae]CAG7637950.1 Putative oxidoreductase YteT [Paenibacillus allorhizosphaerae]